MAAALLSRQRACGWLMAGLAALFASLAGAAPDLTLEQIAPGLHVHWGAQEESHPGNEGAIANSALLIGERCVAVIDPGGSPAFGQRLRQALAVLSDKPVCAVINTHLHPDHMLGNAAFVGPGTLLYGHHRLGAELAPRSQAYLATAQRELGAAMAGAQIHAPTEQVQGRQWLDLGGRRLLLQAHDSAHTRTDLTVWDEASDTLFTGDLLFVDHVPVVDASVRGWLRVLDELARQHPRQAVPGHGPLVRHWAQGAQAQHSYLQRLLQDTRLALAQGHSLQQAMVSTGQNRERWLLFETFHRRNVATVYTELEWE